MRLSYGGCERVAETGVGVRTDLLADDGELVVLELLEGLFAGDVSDDTGGIDHAGAEEPGERASKR